LTYFKTSLAAS